MTARGSKTEGRHHRSGIVLGCSFLLGCLLGVLLAADLSNETVRAISGYLSDYLKLIEQGEIPRSVPDTFWSHGRWIALCAVAGVSTLGIVFLPALVCFRGFLLSFAVGCFACLFGRAGIVPSMVFFGISALVWMPALYLTAAAALKCSVRRIALKRENVQQAAVFGRKFYESILLSILMLVLCVCIECWIVPALLPIVAEMIC